MANKLDDYRAIEIRCDTANDWIAPVRVNTGDLDGRTLRAVLTNGGQDINADGITARLLFNPKPDDPDSFGDFVTMTSVAGAPTATFEAPVPTGALTKTGETRMGFSFIQGEGDARSIVCTRPFGVTVEGGVLNLTSGGAVGEFEAMVDRAETAADNADKSAKAADTSEKLAAQHLADIGDSKDAAAASAAAAKASETNAKNSETNAKASETNAKASETAANGSSAAALASEKAAKTSETNAKASETAAKTSETAAKASETNAKTSETNAAASAAQAAASAEQAGRYADAAEQSATDAAASATTATQASTDALASEKAAKTSETNAKASETAAAASAQAARDAVDGFGLDVAGTDTLAPGSKATATITKDGNTYHATFGIPQGERGENTAAISEITLEYTPGTGTPDFHVEAGGTPTDRTIKFVASNLEGADGHTPAITAGTTTTLDPGTQATFTATTDEHGDVTLDVGIPRGADGRDGTDANVTDANVAAVLDQPLSAAKITQLAGGQTISRQATFEPDDFTQDDTGLWHADKPVDGLGTIALASPVGLWDNVQAYSSAGPVIADHTDDAAIPANTVRCTCQAQPADGFVLNITTIKE